MDDIQDDIDDAALFQKEQEEQQQIERCKAGHRYLGSLFREKNIRYVDFLAERLLNPNRN